MEHWSILTLAQRLEAAARGLPAVVTGSLVGSSMAATRPTPPWPRRSPGAAGVPPVTAPPAVLVMPPAPTPPRAGDARPGGAARARRRPAPRRRRRPPRQPGPLRAPARGGVGRLGGPPGCGGHRRAGGRRPRRAGPPGPGPGPPGAGGGRDALRRPPGGLLRRRGSRRSSYGEDIPFWVEAARRPAGTSPPSPGPTPSIPWTTRPTWGPWGRTAWPGWWAQRPASWKGDAEAHPLTIDEPISPWEVAAGLAAREVETTMAGTTPTPCWPAPGWRTWRRGWRSAGPAPPAGPCGSPPSSALRLRPHPGRPLHLQPPGVPRHPVPLRRLDRAGHGGGRPRHHRGGLPRRRRGGPARQPELHRAGRRAVPGRLRRGQRRHQPGRRLRGGHPGPARAPAVRGGLRHLTGRAVARAS